MLRITCTFLVTRRQMVCSNLNADIVGETLHKRVVHILLTLVYTILEDFVLLSCVLQ